jgi:cytochrome c553
MAGIETVLRDLGCERRDMLLPRSVYAMKRVATFIAVALACGACHERAAPPPTEPPPAWAYPSPTGDAGATGGQDAVRRVPDSTVTMPRARTEDPFFAPDWHPEDHGPMPGVVARGRTPDVCACGYCHRADGSGGPENASLAGLSPEYIAGAISDFATGMRVPALPGRAPSDGMVRAAKALTPDEVAAVAAYFSALPARGTVRVVEADVIPELRVAGSIFADARTGRTEPLGPRIAEVPESLEDFESRDGRARFVAYVPKGTIDRGRMLATTGGGKTTACASCHGPELRGVGAIPRIAGRSPTYLARQLYEIGHGFRKGPRYGPMMGVVANLTPDDRIALAAYVATLTP